MSVALKIPDATPFHPPLKFSDNELNLRDEFIAAFNGTRTPGWELHIAVWGLTGATGGRGSRTNGIYERGLIEDYGQLRTVLDSPRSSISPR
jgi:hypothetical protein